MSGDSGSCNPELAGYSVALMSVMFAQCRPNSALHLLRPSAYRFTVS